MVELAYLTLHLKNRPTFQTECDIINETCRIIATRPELELTALNLETRGKLLHHAAAFDMGRPDCPPSGLPALPWAGRAPATSCRKARAPASARSASLDASPADHLRIGKRLGEPPAVRQSLPGEPSGFSGNLR
jgi:hypothetical protein